MPGKNPTVKSLKIGDILVLGAYSAQGNGENPVPIRWIKASTNCDFITERVIDSLVFDAREEWGEEYRPFGTSYHGGDWHRTGGDPNYPLSNIFQFLNSELDEWFIPAHGRDRPPDRLLAPSAPYASHAGFLRYFERYELDAMVEQTVFCENGSATGVVHLMSQDDVFGDDKLPLFRKRRGIRAMPTQDLYLKRATWALPEHYYPYMLRTRFGDGVASVGRDAYNHIAYADYHSGIRPIVRLDPDAKIFLGFEDQWEILAGRRRPKSDFVMPDDPLSLLGLV